MRVGRDSDRNCAKSIVSADSKGLDDAALPFHDSDSCVDVVTRARLAPLVGRSLENWHDSPTLSAVCYQRYYHIPVSKPFREELQETSRPFPMRPIHFIRLDPPD